MLLQYEESWQYSKLVKAYVCSRFTSSSSVGNAKKNLTHTA